MLRLGWMRIGFFLGVVALIAPACGDDEAQIESDSNGGATNNGGAGGGATVTTGPNGTGGGVANSFLGIECEMDTDCPTGLICLSSTSDSLTEGGPAHGFCTFACGGEDQSPEQADEECQRFDPDSLCQFFTDDAAYCVQRCDLGSSAEKCQNREDVVCDLVLHLPRTRATCESDSDCDINDFCVPSVGECFSAPAVCLPRCGVDADCPVGRYCDPRWGECVDEEPSGRDFGEVCDPEADVDQCAGTCDAIGECTQKCVVGSYPACGSENEARATAACIYGFYEESGIGDVGVCGHLCDCNADCLDHHSCIQFEDQGGVPYELRGRRGRCEVPRPDDVVLGTCETNGGSGGSGGSGGTAGSDAGGAAGLGGSAGQGGSP